MRWTAQAANLVDAATQHDGYHLILELLDERRGDIHAQLANPKTSWDETNRLRGELRGIDRVLPASLEQKIRQGLKEAPDYA